MIRQFTIAVLLLAAIFVGVNAYGAVSEEAKKEARKLFDRGIAAVEMAKTEDDYLAAAGQFNGAVSIDPEFRDARYNLVVMLDKGGLYKTALENLNILLESTEPGKEKEDLESLKTKLEYKMEMSEDKAAEEAAKNIAIDEIQGEVTGLVFFEGTEAETPMDQRNYAKFFDKSSTRRVKGELRLSHPAPGDRKYFELEVVYIRPNGSVLGHLKYDTYIESDWITSSHPFYWGWPRPGQWPVGRYQVEVYNKNKLIASEEFSIY